MASRSSRGRRGRATDWHSVGADCSTPAWTCWDGPTRRLGPCGRSAHRPVSTARYFYENFTDKDLVRRGRGSTTRPHYDRHHHPGCGSRGAARRMIEPGRRSGNIVGMISADRSEAVAVQHQLSNAGGAAQADGTERVVHRAVRHRHPECAAIGGNDCITGAARLVVGGRRHHHRLAGFTRSRWRPRNWSPAGDDPRRTSTIGLFRALTGPVLAQSFRTRTLH